MSDQPIDLDKIRLQKINEAKILELKELSDRIDVILTDAFNNGTHPEEIVGVLSNRLGECCRAIYQTTGDDLVDKCVDLLVEQFQRY
jgi:hypothetical protein